jgi:hypothetical protein
MPYINILEGCNNSIAGLKTIKLIAKLYNGEAINYPISIPIVNNQTTIQEDIDNRKVTIDGYDYEFRFIYPNESDSWQELINTRQGKVWEKRLSFVIPKLQLSTNNQIRDFLFNANGQFAISQCFAILTDTNNQNWIMGYDSPLTLSEFDLQTNDGNSYSFVYKSFSYNPSIRYNVI